MAVSWCPSGCSDQLTCGPTLWGTPSQPMPSCFFPVSLLPPPFLQGLSSWDPGLVQSPCLAPGQVWQAVDGCSAPHRHGWLDKCKGGWMDRQVDESAGLGRPQDGGEPVPRRPPPSTCLPTQFLLLCRPWSLCSVQHRYHCHGAGQEAEGHTHWTPVQYQAVKDTAAGDGLASRQAHCPRARGRL